MTGLKVLEFAGLAPGPFAGLLLSDSGASVLRIDRPSASSAPTPDLLTRHKSSLPVDLKSPRGRSLILALAKEADVLIDPYRPGVLEKLGLGPSDLLAVNPSLIYARMTGFRPDGRYAQMAGHDINYLAVSGVLSQLGRKETKPTPPINILGDFAGGGAVLFQGILLALLARERNGGKGQVVEANMVDGVSYLGTFPRFTRHTPSGDQPRGENLLDSGCPFYDVYETKPILTGQDESGHGGGGKQYMAVGALEPQFFAALIRGLGLEGQGWEEKRFDRSCWDELRRAFEETFRTKTREEWERIFDGTDACCTPILGWDELEPSQTTGRKKEKDGNSGSSREKREGDQRPIVTLRETPLLAVNKGAEDVRHGQGDGVEGEGYTGRPLKVGEGGAETLRRWMGWVQGREFGYDTNGAVVLLTSKPGSKL